MNRTMKAGEDETNEDIAIDHNLIKKQTGVLKTLGDNARVVRDLQEGDKSLKKLSKLSNFRVTHPGKLNVSN